MTCLNQWISICICHIRFRRALKKAGRQPTELVWKSPWGVYGSYLAITVTASCMVAQVVSAALPPVLETDVSRLELLFMGILGFIVVGLLFIGHLLYVFRRDGKTWRTRLWVPVDDIPMDDVELPQPEEEERRESAVAYVPIHGAQNAGNMVG